MRHCCAGAACRAVAATGASLSSLCTANTAARLHHSGACGCHGSGASVSSITPLTSSAGLFASIQHHHHNHLPHGGGSGGDSPTIISKMQSRSLLHTKSPSASSFYPTAPLMASAGVQRRQCSSSSSSNSGTFADGGRPYMPGQNVQEKYPIVQLPARSLWCKQYNLDPRRVAQGEYMDLIAQVKAARHYYQYPSLSAPQTGWNVQMFTLFDNTVFINPVNLDEEAWRAEATAKGVPWVVYEEEKMRELRGAGKTGFAWEPCASSGFMLHYIERPLTVRVRALDEQGKAFTVELDRMRGRMALHELDHLQGVLFTRRVVDTDHVVPMEGFVTMSDWSDDYPSLEARSTFLYTIFTPPYHFTTDSVEDGNLLDRKFEDGIYPGCEQDRQQRIESAAAEELQRNQWRTEKKKQQEATQPATEAEDSGNEKDAVSPDA